MNIHRIAVIGTINRDIIITSRGTCHESLGGILYNVLAFAELGAELLSVSPITYAGPDVKPSLFEILHHRKAISLEGINGIPGSTNTNRLRYLNENERKETLAFHTPPIPFEMIEPYLDYDILLFNFIAGYDVSLETLQAVRNRTGAFLCVDVHSMVLKQTMDEERTFGSVKHWQTWAAQADMIQMNTKELLYFTGNGDRGKPADAISVRTLMKELLDLGPQLVVITAGKRGVYLGTPQGIYFFPQRYRAPAKDTTGCGDIFTASFLAKLLVSQDPFIACDYANVLAGFATREKGIKKCSSLKHFSPLCMIPNPSTTSTHPLLSNHSRSGSCGSP
jgi:sugar/nucleoside kinase (ribokinase family)